ncbi:MAG: hypothetical protein V1799_17250 [bacterium]
MSSITVREVQSNKDRDEFIKFLWKIYDGNPYWVPPLLIDRKKLMDRQKKPFYKHADVQFLIAEQDGEMVGRIAAIVNHNHIKEHQEQVGFFGFFESINDQQVANTLFDAAKKFLKEKGMTAVRGPANPSVNDEYGLLIKGFDQSPTILMTYNPEYYPTLIERYGFSKAKDLYAYLLKQELFYSEKMVRANRLIRERNHLTFRCIDMKDFHRDVEIIKKLYNTAWAKNWGAVPMTEDEMDTLAKDLKPLVVPELVVFAERNGEPVGFSLAMPDINVSLKYNKKGRLLPGLFHLFFHKKEINLVRILVLGVLPEYLNTGAGGALFYETAVHAKELGYDFGEASWILEDNERMVRSAELMQGEISKTYRIYQMTI